MKKGIDTDEFTMKLNILRIKTESLRKDYSQSEIVELLKSYGLPYSISYFSAYVKYSIIIRSDRGVYKFPDEPVYRGIIETALESVRRYKLDNAKKMSSKAVMEQEAKQIETYIQFLKERGYVIFKQV